MSETSAEAFSEEEYAMIEEQQDQIDACKTEGLELKQQITDPEDDLEVQAALEEMESMKGELDTARKTVVDYINSTQGKKETGFVLKQLRTYETDAATLTGKYKQLLEKYKVIVEKKTQEVLHEIINDVQDNAYAYRNYESLSAEDRAGGAREEFQQIRLESEKTKELYEKNREILLQELTGEAAQQMVEQRQFEYDKLVAKQHVKLDDVGNKELVAAQQKVKQAQGLLDSAQKKIEETSKEYDSLEEADPEDIILVQNTLQKEKKSSGGLSAGGAQKMTHASWGRLQKMQKRKRTKCRRCGPDREFGKVY